MTAYVRKVYDSVKNITRWFCSRAIQKIINLLQMYLIIVWNNSKMVLTICVYLQFASTGLLCQYWLFFEFASTINTKALNVLV
jgi:hypothetical protein